jgi:clan AA aspartic protease (TIGR02281 family)
VKCLITILLLLIPFSNLATAQSNLQRCKGEYLSEIWNNCFGIFNAPNGNRYEGEFQNNMPNGRGIFNWAEGGRYEGGYVDGLRHGQGVRYYPNGKIEKGEFRKGEYVGVIGQSSTAFTESQSAKTSSTRVRMIQSGGTYKVPARLNDQITLNFTVDSGASDVSVPADVVLTLIRTNTITDSDFRGEQTYRLADGSTVKSRQFILRTITVGNKVVHNVTASVADIKGSLLLGQSFLKQFRSWSIDNNTNELILINHEANNGMAASKSAAQLTSQVGVQQSPRSAPQEQAVNNQPSRSRFPQPFIFTEVVTMQNGYQSALSVAKLNFKLRNSYDLTFIKPTIKARFYTPNGSFIGELCNSNQLPNLSYNSRVEGNGYVFGRCNRGGDIFKLTADEKFIFDSEGASMRIKIFLVEAITSNRESVTCDETLCAIN